MLICLGVRAMVEGSQNDEQMGVLEDCFAEEKTPTHPAVETEAYRNGQSSFEH